MCIGLRLSGVLSSTHLLGNSGGGMNLQDDTPAPLAPQPNMPTASHTVHVRGSCPAPRAASVPQIQLREAPSLSHVTPTYTSPLSLEHSLPAYNTQATISDFTTALAAYPRWGAFVYFSKLKQIKLSLEDFAMLLEISDCLPLCLCLEQPAWQVSLQTPPKLSTAR